MIKNAMEKLSDDAFEVDHDAEVSAFENRAYARTPPGHQIYADASPVRGASETGGDWSFFQDHYKNLLRLSVAWGGYYGKGPRSSYVPTGHFTFDGDSSQSDLLDALEGMGGTHLTIAAVWYVVVVSAGAFKPRTQTGRSSAPGCVYKSDVHHQHLFWWLDSQLLELATTEVATSQEYIITLPSGTPLADKQKTSNSTMSSAKTLPGKAAGSPKASSKTSSSSFSSSSSSSSSAMSSSYTSSPEPSNTGSETDIRDAVDSELDVCKNMMETCGADHGACVDRYCSIFYEEENEEDDGHTRAGCLQPDQAADVVVVDADE